MSCLHLVQTLSRPLYFLSEQKNEVVLKEQRNEDGTRNQNGRLYKDRNPEQERPVKGSGATSPGRGTMRLIGTFLLAFLLVLLTTLGMGTATMATPPPDQTATKVGTDRQWKRHQHVARAALRFDLGPKLVERSVALNNRSSWKRKLWERGAPAK